MTVTQPKANVTEISRALSVLFQLGDVVELRVLDVAGKTHAGYFNDFGRLANEATKLSGQAAGVYAVLNPINKDLLARSQNRIRISPKNLTQDTDITGRRWLPIDADADRPMGISSTDEEHEAAIATAKNVKVYLIGLGFPANSIIIGDSGNGGHVLVRVDLPNDPETKSLVESCIKAIAAKFNNDKVIIDPSVFNASRIWKLPGTLARKGDNTDDRPHRIARLLDVPTNITIASIESVWALAATAPKPETPKQNKKTHHRNGQKFNLQSWLTNNGIEVKSAGPYEGGMRFILKVCPFDSNHNGTSAAIFQMATGAIGFKCQHASCVDKSWADLRELKEPGYQDRKNGHQNKTHTGNAILNDTTNAEYLANLYGKVLRYDHRRQRFLIWKGHRWRPDNNGEVYRLAIAATRDRYERACDIYDLDERKRISNWAIGSENRSRLESTIAIAKNLSPISDTGENWDNNPWLLGVQNGVIDLKTGTLRDGKPDDNITMSTGVKFDPNAKCSLWLSTLEGIFEGDNDLIDWLWRYDGYSITGLVKEQTSVIGHGEGGNGKGIVAGVFRKVMGDYAYDAPFSTFEMNYRSSIPNDIAALEHKRIVTSSETNDGTRLNEARLKAISHGDPITARYLHAEFFTYEPECKIFLFVNHKPRVKDDSFGFWRGVRLVPFLRRFDGAEDDKDLAKKLEAEKSGILNWLIQACLEWQKRGLSPIPDKITTATTEYKRESNALADFYEDCTIEDSKKMILSSLLYQVYLWWAKKSNLREHEILSSIMFSKCVKEKFQKIHEKDGNYFVGIAFVTDLVTGFSLTNPNYNVLPAIESLTRENIEKPSISINPSLFDNKKIKKILMSLDDICPGCGGNELGLLPDGSGGYYCINCHPEIANELLKDNGND